MDLGLQDKVAIVAGASRGIGKAVALTLAAEGCHVALATRSKVSPAPVARAMPWA
jgi:3-oxoacyl-[acyl-carrier protein] reductase